jgi:hypothetical protein
LTRSPTVFAIAIVLASAGLAANVPRPSPEFVIHMPDGKETLITQYRGKVLAVAFVSTTCPHCQRLTKVLSAIQTDFGTRGVQILETIINQNGAQLLPAFIQQFRPNFPTGYAEFNAVLEYLQLSMMTPGYVPKMVFIDRKGVIQSQYEGQNPFFTDPDQDKNIRAELEKMLTASAPAGKAAKKK